MHITVACVFSQVSPFEYQIRTIAVCWQGSPLTQMLNVRANWPAAVV